MRVWKQWTDEYRTTRKIGSGRRKVTSVRNDRHVLRMAVNDCTASSRQLATIWSTATGSPSRQTIDGCVCNGLLSTESGKLIDAKLSFQINHISICGTMLAVFVLDAMSVNAAFQSALSNDIVNDIKRHFYKQQFTNEASKRAVLLARWIIRSVPLEIVGNSGHEKVPTRGKPGLERPGRPRGERIEGSCSKQLWTPQ
ncbi:uncharacterized protein TNCV_3462311 [Trichonephila clavipes]|nr:uncharacterized protein TNCV_3462311 [Trichonephila clavipes]